MLPEDATDHKLFVTDVRPSSFAEKAGLKKYDEVITLIGVETDSRKLAAPPAYGASDDICAGNAKDWQGWQILAQTAIGRVRSPEVSRTTKIRQSRIHAYARPCDVKAMSRVPTPIPYNAARTATWCILTVCLSRGCNSNMVTS